MTDPAMTAKNNNSSKISKKIVEVKSFYNKHFPTDKKTYNWRLPFVGLILSILALHFVTTEFAVRWFFREDGSDILRYCYVFVATAIGYEFHYGLRIGDRKQYTPWILLKLIEICLIFAAIIYVFVYRSPYLRYMVGDIIYGFIILGLNSGVTYIVTSKSLRQFRGHQSRTDIDENIYDNYDDV